jgi:aspartate ammonia-lyase
MARRGGARHDRRKFPRPFRTEHDSMGELQVPAAALWGAQTQRAVQNFPHLRAADAARPSCARWA